MAATPRRAEIYAGTRIPSLCPTISPDRPRTKHDLDDILEGQLRAEPPVDHGVLRLIVQLDGEHVAGIEPAIGDLHTGFEKNDGAEDYWKGITYPERIHYLSFQANELVFVLAIEKLPGLETPEKATCMRMCLSELNRLHSHLVLARDVRARARRDLDVLVRVPRTGHGAGPVRDGHGARMHTATSRPAASPRTLEGFYAQAATSPRHMPRGGERLRGDARPQQNLAGADEGHRARSPRTMRSRSGSRADAAGLRRRLGPLQQRCRTSPTTRSTSTCPCTRTATSTTVQGAHGRDAGPRRASSPSASTRLEENAGQAVDRTTTARSCSAASIARHVDGVADPPLQDRHRGLLVPEGEVYVAVESARGECGCYLVSDGGAEPWRVKFRAPSFAALQATATCVRGTADRRPDRRRRLARPVMGDVDR